MSLSPREALARRKLLTRCRGILLDNGIFNAQQTHTLDLTTLPGIGPKAEKMIREAINLDSPDTLILFPYPDGIDDTRFGPAPTEAPDAALNLALGIIEALLGLVIDLTRERAMRDAEPIFKVSEQGKPVVSSAGTC